MNSLIEIQNQIAVLQKQAEEIKMQEFEAAVREIHAKMDEYGITVADLDNGKGRPRKAASGKSGKTGHQAPPKYWGPNGETWSGRGLMPRWLVKLVNEGHTKESFTAKP